MSHAGDCPLCSGPGGELLWRDDRLRVIAVDDALHPGFARVVWNAHVREMTDLDADDRAYCMAVVLAVESAVRDLVRPDKINLASFGNVVPHLHWHVIPRWTDDPHFPEPVWGARRHERAHPVSPDYRIDMQERLIRVLGPGVGIATG
ncbi:MAG: HIT family protein [Burkholderiales bacterium]|nr:HIT family protein [Burkholderiales bacterium]